MHSIGSKSVDLDVLLLQGELGGEELHHLDSLVTLQLDNLSKLIVLHNVTVASKILLQNLENSLEIVLIWNSLDGRQGLTAISLLDTDVDVVRRLSVVVPSVSKWVKGIQVLQTHKMIGGG